MREIVLDTETTGLDPSDGHRIIEIGCVELMDHLPTGRTFQCYLNPERDIPIESQRVHGITDEFIADKPLFASVVDELFAFIGDAPLVIHNAGFDLKFLNAELSRLQRTPLAYARAIDTIDIAKSKIPGARYSLDELCKRFGIDLTSRSKHGALLDATLLAQVYLELVGGRQTRFNLTTLDAEAGSMGEMRAARVRPTPLPSRANAAEAEGHAAFVTRELGDDAVWNWN
jgi:DNA polymerase III subunit epsilon